MKRTIHNLEDMLAVSMFFYCSGRFLNQSILVKIMVSQRLLGELQIILKEEYGKDVQNEEALQIGNGLVAYFDLLAELNHQMVSDTLSEEK